MLCGYKRIIDVSRWEPVSKNIWRIKLAEENFAGWNEANVSSLNNNIGCIHEYDLDLVHGRKMQYREELKQDWDIWQTERFDKETPATEFDYLYLFLTKDPRQLKLELSIASAAASVEKSTIENIDFVGFGFGIAAKTNAVIRKCRIDAIGGIIQLGTKSYVCYGNGIEFWVSKNLYGGLVENNVISRCYDSGCTIQGRVSSPENIIFRKNLIYNCCQGWEDFLTNDDPNVTFRNCVFEKNTVLNSGDSGFGYPKTRFKYCHVLGNNFKGNKGMIICQNTFIGGNYYCSGSFQKKYMSNVWRNNTCIIKRGDYIIGNYDGTKDVVRIPSEKGKYSSLRAATKATVAQYRELTGDKTTKFVIEDEETINKRVNKLKNKFLHQ